MYYLSGPTRNLYAIPRKDRPVIDMDTEANVVIKFRAVRQNALRICAYDKHCNVSTAFLCILKISGKIQNIPPPAHETRIPVSPSSPTQNVTNSTEARKKRNCLARS